MLDCLVIGGGIVGLSIAYEVAQSGARVHVIDRRRSQRSASWAAAGILPPPIHRATHDGMEQLRAMSHRLYPRWCRDLSERSGIAVDYQACGGIYLARKPGETAALRAALAQWRADGVDVQELDADALRFKEPALAELDTEGGIYFLKDEAQVRPPRLLQALSVCLDKSHVPLTAGVEITRWHKNGSRILAVETNHGTIEARDFCIATGAWSQETLFELELDLPIEPWRGQMLMWKLKRPIIQHVINEGPRYVLSRSDGCLLAGSTVEDVGFDDRTTEEGIAELSNFAGGLLPQLRNIPPSMSWSAFRPKSRDGLPLLGRIPQYENVIVATGHFRSGIHLAPATARVVRKLLQGDLPEAELSSFAPHRP